MLDRTRADLLAAEIHLKLQQTVTWTARVPDAHLFRSGGSAAHACVRVWSRAGQALVCVEEATQDAMSWALEMASRAATAAGGAGDDPPPAVPAPPPDHAADVEPAEPAEPEPDLQPLVLELAMAARDRGLPVRDVRLTSRRVEIATLSTAGIAAAETRHGRTAGAYVAFHHSLEPSDALTTAFHPADAVAAAELLLLRLQEQQSLVAQAQGDPLTSVPAGIPVLCRPRATAHLLAVIAARDFGGHRARAGRAPTASWSGRLRIEMNPRDVHNPRCRRFDDEGLPTRRFPLVAGGVQTAYLHTMATAAVASHEPNACAARGPSHLPVPSFRGLDLTPTHDRPPDPDEAFLVDDLIVGQEARNAVGGVVALGRLRMRGTVRPARVSTGGGLLHDFATRTCQVVADGHWGQNGVRGRTVLIG